jgi:hypothetical protein
MPADLSEVGEALKAMYAVNLRHAVEAATWPLFGDRTVTRIRIAPNLFPRARRAYRAFWEMVYRTEGALEILRFGRHECDPD